MDRYHRDAARLDPYDGNVRKRCVVSDQHARTLAPVMHDHGNLRGITDDMLIRHKVAALVDDHTRAEIGFPNDAAVAVEVLRLHDQRDDPGRHFVERLGEG